MKKDKEVAELADIAERMYNHLLWLYEIGKSTQETNYLMEEYETKFNPKS